MHAHTMPAVERVTPNGVPTVMLPAACCWTPDCTVSLTQK
uniref:Uncharacterized protein n=1 Tax=Anguilla anguilla TaxID=7936 RepID=A0A0E9Q259_ANGAN